jgi:hypothetical protein
VRTPPWSLAASDSCDRAVVYYLPESWPILSRNPWLDGIGPPTSAGFSGRGYLHHSTAHVKGKIIYLTSGE